MDRRGSCSRSKLEQETITTHLLYIPGDSSGEFWNGKVEGVIANSNSFCYLPALCLLSGGFPPTFVFVTLLSIHTPTGIWRLLSLVPKESQLGSSSIFSFHNSWSSIPGGLLLKRSQIMATYGKESSI